MDKALLQLFKNIQSKVESEYTKSLSDLKFVIERFTMNRYDLGEKSDYLKMFYDSSLIEYRMHKSEYDFVKYFLFYLLLNFPDRSLSTAKCIKVLFDNSVLEAICNSIELFLKKDDKTTYELILAITDQDEFGERFSNKRIMDLFKYISEFGGELSKRAVKEDLLHSTFR